MNSILDLLALGMIASILLAILVTYLILRKDKNFMIALMFAEAFVVIVAATWFAERLFYFVVRYGGFDAQASLRGSPANYTESIIGMVVCGLFSVIMMMLRHREEMRRIGSAEQSR